MSLGVYAELLRIPRLGILYAAAFITRIPTLALPLVVTLLVVQGMDRSYADAGLVAAAETVGAGIGGPWRGRLLDRLGLRRTLAPSIAVLLVCYPLMAIAGFHLLIVLSFFAGLYQGPVFSVVRLALAVAVPEEQQRTAFAFDSVMSEAGFIIGPAAAGVLVVAAGPHWSVLVVGACAAGGILVFWLLDPPLTSGAGVTVDVAATIAEEGPVSDSAPTSAPADQWLTLDVMFLFLVSAGFMVVLMATDLGIIAALREKDAIGLVGVTYLGWGGASLLGGLLYGAFHRRIRPSYLLLAMSLATIPAGLAHEPWLLALAVIPAGFLCAPGFTAATEYVTELVAEHRRGEATGWLGTSYTVGAAVASPLIGLAIDRTGAWGGFAVGGVVGVLVALLSLCGQRLALLPRVSSPARDGS